MPRRDRQPSIRFADAEQLCDEIYPDPATALAVVRRLRAAGWVVVEHRPPVPVRPDGLRLLATVYHPHSYESPGDLLVAPATSRPLP